MKDIDESDVKLFRRCEFDPRLPQQRSRTSKGLRCETIISGIRKSIPNMEIQQFRETSSVSVTSPSVVQEYFCLSES